MHIDRKEQDTAKQLQRRPIPRTECSLFCGVWSRKGMGWPVLNLSKGLIPPLCLPDWPPWRTCTQIWTEQALIGRQFKKVRLVIVEGIINSCKPRTDPILQFSSLSFVPGFVHLLSFSWVNSFSIWKKRGENVRVQMGQPLMPTLLPHVITQEHGTEVPSPWAKALQRFRQTPGLIIKNEVMSNFMICFKIL